MTKNLLEKKLKVFLQNLLKKKFKYEKKLTKDIREKIG